MGQRLIADNWSLQSVVSLLEQGLDQDDSTGIGPLVDPYTAPTVVPQAALDLEALFDFLTDLVLRDQILVDDQYVDTWMRNGGPLHELTARSLIKPHPFTKSEGLLEQPRKDLVRRLILNDHMAALQRENEEGYAQNKRSPHPFAGALIWGGAGMLARAWVNEAAYTPHPLRRRLLERAALSVPAPVDAAALLKGAVQRHRASLYKVDGWRESVFGAQLLLPAVPAAIMREAASLNDVFRVALQMRNDLGPLRGWLSDYQNALASEKFDDVAFHARRLAKISKAVDRALGVKSNDGATLSLGWGWCKLNIKLDPSRVWTRFDRVHVQASSLVLAPSGTDGLRKLLGFFGHRHSALGLRIQQHFVRTH